jgi:hypothetical protein
MTAEMMKGTRVTVRAFGDCPAARCIWGEDGGSVLVCLEEEFQQWEGGGSDPVTVSLPKTHIYKYENTLFDNLVSAYRRVRESVESSSARGLQDQLQRLWSQATPLFPASGSEMVQAHSGRR